MIKAAYARRAEQHRSDPATRGSLVGLALGTAASTAWAPAWAPSPRYSPSLVWVIDVASSCSIVGSSVITRKVCIGSRWGAVIARPSA